MKLETNMYVRTKRGIVKFLGYCEQDLRSGKIEEFYYEEDDISRTVCLVEDIIKARHNIIDLIEPLDLLFIDISPDDFGGIVVPRIAETLAELEIYKERIKSGEHVLKAVLTKEQIQANIYKLDDSNA